MKTQILKLRDEGKTYREIEKELGCCRSLISYYVNPNGKTTNLKRQNRNRFLRRKKYKDLLGSKCSICGYNKCTNALQFHHTNPKTKKFAITDALWKLKVTEQEILNEIKKCILICANCHAELHAKNDF